MQSEAIIASPLCEFDKCRNVKMCSELKIIFKSKHRRRIGDMKKGKSRFQCSKLDRYQIESMINSSCAREFRFFEYKSRTEKWGKSNTRRAIHYLFSYPYIGKLRILRNALRWTGNVWKCWKVVEQLLYFNALCNVEEINAGKAGSFVPVMWPSMYPPQRSLLLYRAFGKRIFEARTCNWCWQSMNFMTSVCRLELWRQCSEIFVVLY